jgi:hypothetical protein
VTEETARTLSQDIEDRMGIYKRLEQVPQRYQLANYAGDYAEEDTWAEFTDIKTERFDSDATRTRYEKAGRYLADYLSDIGRHHALCNPGHVAGFLRALRDGSIGRQSHTRKLQTVYFEYFQPVEEFYSWLLWHTEHPHVYHPVHMAVVEYDYPSEVWAKKLSQNDKR